jgi:hypothetical protein
VGEVGKNRERKIRRESKDERRGKSGIEEVVRVCRSAEVRCTVGKYEYPAYALTAYLGGTCECIGVLGFD